jgi:hypothetical protein
MDPKTGGFRSGVGDPIGSGLDKKERDLPCFTTDEVGKVSNLVEQSDRKENGEHAIEEDGALGRHVL